MSGEGLQIDKELDRETAMQIIALVMGGATPPPGNTGQGRASSRSRSTRRRGGKTKAESGSGATKQRRSSPSIVKDLTLRPQGKKAFTDFANEKAPTSHQQRQAVILYWLEHEAGMDAGITVDHINTCYQGAGWKRPANLGNALSVTANKKGWIDPSDRANIKLTVAGEDFVTHELPEAKER